MKRTFNHKLHYRGGIYQVYVRKSKEYTRLSFQITENEWEYFTFEDKNVKPI